MHIIQINNNKNEFYVGENIMILKFQKLKELQYTFF